MDNLIAIGVHSMNCVDRRSRCAMYCYILRIVIQTVLSVEHVAKWIHLTELEDFQRIIGTATSRGCSIFVIVNHSNAFHTVLLQTQHRLFTSDKFQSHSTLSDIEPRWFTQC